MATTRFLESSIKGESAERSREKPETEPFVIRAPAKLNLFFEVLGKGFILDSA